MSAKQKKSKKRSAANSRLPSQGITYYLDRNLGKHVIADALHSSGASVEVHDDHLSPTAPDEDWIALVAKKNWLAVTKDRNIRYRAGELAAIKEHGAMVLVVRAANATGGDIADILVKSQQRIARFVKKHKPPFVARIGRAGQISLYDL